MKTPSSENTEAETAIFQKIRDSGSGAVPFSEFMELALYHPEWGYYRDPEARKIGRTGDFFTSVSVGDCFGKLLSWEIERCWRERFGAPDSFTIVEQGAHDGQFAADILEDLSARESELAGRVRYLIIEPSDLRRRRLNERFGGSVEVVSEAGGIREACGVFLSNELLDAFPVHRVRYQEGKWKELWVTLEENEKLAWRAVDLVADSELSREGRQLGFDFPEGYTTEICMEIDGWSRSIAPLFERGIWWVIDYGFEEGEYFAPHRTQGTLQCYRNHQSVAEPFEFPGETDITAHVNFSHLFRAMADAGLEKTLFVDQHDFLTRAALPWLTQMEKEETTQSPENRKRLRQFQTLTHPGMMGRVFKVAEFVRGL